MRVCRTVCIPYVWDRATYSNLYLKRSSKVQVCNMGYYRTQKPNSSKHTLFYLENTCPNWTSINRMFTNGLPLLCAVWYQSFYKHPHPRRERRKIWILGRGIQKYCTSNLVRKPLNLLLKRTSWKSMFQCKSLNTSTLNLERVQLCPFWRAYLLASTHTVVTSIQKCAELQKRVA